MSIPTTLRTVVNTSLRDARPMRLHAHWRSSEQRTYCFNHRLTPVACYKNFLFLKLRKVAGIDPTTRPLVILGVRASDCPKVAECLVSGPSKSGRFCRRLHGRIYADPETKRSVTFNTPDESDTFRCSAIGVGSRRKRCATIRGLKLPCNNNRRENHHPWRRSSR
jgi:hypothetical protein